MFQIPAQTNSFQKSSSKENFYTVLTNFEPIIPTSPISQNILLDIFSKLVTLAQPNDSQDLETLEKSILEKIYHYGVSPTIINKRQVNIFTKKDINISLEHAETHIFKDVLIDPKGAGLKERMNLFGEIADKVLEIAYPNDSLPPDDIIHVSCSGYLAPSPVEKMVSQKSWKTTVTHAYHMGCYGSIPALRMATGFLTASNFGLGKPKAQIDIVHTEFLTLHVDLTSLAPRDILAMTLFGDGFIKYSLCSQNNFVEKKINGLKILALQETIIPNSLAEMLWNLSSHNFEMILSKKIPFLIRDNILSFVEELMSQAGLDFAKEKERLIFAIHPGGPKIIEFIQRSLKITLDQAKFSHQILNQFGNMSSATLPHIWERILSSKDISIGSLVLSIAFGPGLTAAGAIMEKV